MTKFLRRWIFERFRVAKKKPNNISIINAHAIKYDCFFIPTESILSKTVGCVFISVTYTNNSGGFHRVFIKIIL